MTLTNVYGDNGWRVRQPLLFKQLCMKISFGHDIFFYNRGLQTNIWIVYLHLNQEQLKVLQAPIGSTLLSNDSSVLS